MSDARVYLARRVASGDCDAVGTLVFLAGLAFLTGVAWAVLS